MSKVKNILKEKGGRLITVPPNATVSEAMILMMLETIGAVIVVDDEGTLMGILSERDLIYGMDGVTETYLNNSVASLMTREVQICEPDDSIAHAAKLMGMYRIRHLPVLDGTRLAGMISIRDILSWNEKMGQAA